MFSISDLLLCFETKSSPNATWIKNRGQIPHFLTLLKSGNGQAICPSEFFVQHLGGPNH